VGLANGYYCENDRFSELNSESFFLIRGASMISTRVNDEDSYPEVSEEFMKFEVMIKPRGNVISRFFSAAYIPKDLYLYSDGNFILRERARDLNHSIEIMQKPPFDQVHVTNIEQILHGCISKGYYLVTFVGVSSIIEVFFLVEAEAVEMIDRIKKVDTSVNTKKRK